MINALLDLLFDLKEVPGLRFLEKYYYQINVKRGEHGQYMGDIYAKRDAAIKGAKTLRDTPKNIMKGSKKRR